MVSGSFHFIPYHYSYEAGLKSRIINWHKSIPIYQPNSYRYRTPLIIRLEPLHILRKVQLIEHSFNIWLGIPCLTLRSVPKGLPVRRWAKEVDMLVIVSLKVSITVCYNASISYDCICTWNWWEHTFARAMVEILEQQSEYGAHDDCHRDCIRDYLGAWGCY